VCGQWRKGRGPGATPWQMVLRAHQKPHIVTAVASVRGNAAQRRCTFHFQRRSLTPENSAKTQKKPRWVHATGVDGGQKRTCRRVWHGEMNVSIAWEQQIAPGGADGRRIDCQQCPPTGGRLEVTPAKVQLQGLYCVLRWTFPIG
jgi:hypothetical protein